MVVWGFRLNILDPNDDRDIYYAPKLEHNPQSRNGNPQPQGYRQAPAHQEPQFQNQELWKS